MYRYEIIFEGCVVREDKEFDTWVEAEEDAQDTVKYDLCEEWEDTEVEDYTIEIYEMF